MGALSSIVGRLLAPLIGVPAAVPPGVMARFPELGTAQWRRGGVPPRVGGWCLGRSSVWAITLWDTVFLAPGAPWDAGLLLHEIRHVHQFRASRAFPLRYVWSSLRRGYHANPYELDADAFATARLRTAPAQPLCQDV